MDVNLDRTRVYHISRIIEEIAPKDMINVAGLLVEEISLR